MRRWLSRFGWFRCTAQSRGFLLDRCWLWRGHRCMHYVERSSASGWGIDCYEWGGNGRHWDGERDPLAEMAEVDEHNRIEREHIVRTLDDYRKRNGSFPWEHGSVAR